MKIATSCAVYKHHCDWCLFRVTFCNEIKQAPADWNLSPVYFLLKMDSTPARDTKQSLQANATHHYTAIYRIATLNCDGDLYLTAWTFFLRSNPSQLDCGRPAKLVGGTCVPGASSREAQGSQGSEIKSLDNISRTRQPRLAATPLRQE